MDSIDIKIIKCLQENARVNASIIGEKINMSVSAVIERIKKLELAGIIKQYTVVLDPKKIDMDITAFISIGIEHPKYNEDFRSAVLKNNNIIECHYITGDFDYILKVMASSTQALELVLNDIKNIKGVSATRTLVVFSTIKNNINVLPYETKIK